MEANPIVDASGQRCALKGELSAPMEDEVLAEHEKKRVQLLKGDSAHQHGDTNGQTTSRTQQPWHGEGSEIENVLAHIVPGSREGEDQGNAGDDGMEFEEGNRDFDSSH